MINDFISIKKWEAIWYDCYQITLGNVKSYKRRLKELEKEKSSNELIGKRIALIEYPIT